MLLQDAAHEPGKHDLGVEFPMRIGITFDLRPEASLPANAPDDLYEEFDSLPTVEAVAAVLRGLGHQVELLGNGKPLLQRLLADPPDFVFNFAEGQGISRSREARVPALLEMLDIPYTGSDPLTLAVTLDKDCAKRLVASVGVPVPWGLVVDHGQAAAAAAQVPGWPVIVKPAWEGSSKGIRGKCIVDDPAELTQVLDGYLRDYRQPVLVEEFIEGEELTVGILGNAPPRVLGVMRMVPQEKTERFIYSLEVKRDWERLVRYECPAQLDAAATARVTEAALAAYRVLGCRDVSRLDFRLRSGIPYFLEVNPLPGLNPRSGDIVLLSQLVGWSYADLVGGIFKAAQARYEAPAG